MQLILESVRRQAAADTDGAKSSVSDLRSIQESFDAAIEKSIRAEEERQRAVDILSGRHESTRRTGNSVKFSESPTLYRRVDFVHTVLLK
jgi:hypothetical protein